MAIVINVTVPTPIEVTLTPLGGVGPQGPTGPAGSGGGGGGMTVIDITTDTTVDATWPGSFIQGDSADPFIVTIAAFADVPIETGAHTWLCQAGAGQITVAPADGVTLFSQHDDQFATVRQHAVVELVKVDTDTWRMFGQTAAPAPLITGTPTLEYVGDQLVWTIDYNPAATLVTDVVYNSVDDFDGGNYYDWLVPQDHPDTLPADPLSGRFVWLYFGASLAGASTQAHTNAVDLTAVTPADAAPTAFSVTPLASLSGIAGVCKSGYTDGYPAPTYSGQWQVSTDDGATYTPTGDPVTFSATGNSLNSALPSGLCKCTVTATNTSGSLDADSNVITVT